MLSDEPVRLADIDEGQDVNIYVGSEYWVSNLAVEEAVDEAVDKQSKMSCSRGH